ncbi:60S ribosomal protein L9 [Hordeum vulgare]|nr:60S ribosomal protein L9 [Hordeum vulgare]
MKTILAPEMMEIPEEVTVKVSAKMISMTGPCGTLTRNFKHLNLDFQLEDGGRKLKVDAWFGNRRTMVAIRTAISHVQNLITNVRKVDMLDGVTSLRSEKVKDEIVLDEIDIELVSHSAALINQAELNTYNELKPSMHEEEAVEAEAAQAERDKSYELLLKKVEENDAKYAQLMALLGAKTGN